MEIPHNYTRLPEKEYPQGNEILSDKKILKQNYSIYHGKWKTEISSTMRTRKTKNTSTMAAAIVVDVALKSFDSMRSRRHFKANNVR